MTSQLATSQPAVIFDVDGVLVDSYFAHRQSWRRLAVELGETMSDELFSRTFGRTSREIILEHWDSVSRDDETVQRLDDRKEAYFRELLAAAFPAMPGAVELIRDLSAARIPIAVGSSGPPENVQLVLNQVDPDGAIRVAITGADVTRGKPDPQVFQLASEALGLAPAGCLVVEDAPAGIEAAHAAGMKCVAIASTGRTRSSLSAAELVIDQLDELNLGTIRGLLTP